MKQATLLFAIFFISIAAMAQRDSALYENQRVKINNLLKERSNRFGQYDISLEQRSGIFGWQTKKDIQRSNEILRTIVLNDNDIFKELKVLLDFKDLQKQQVELVNKEKSVNLQAYQNTIQKLQAQSHLLKEQHLKQQQKLGFYKSAFIVLLLVFLLLPLYYLFRMYRNNKAAARPKDSYLGAGGLPPAQE